MLQYYLRYLKILMKTYSTIACFGSLSLVSERVWWTFVPYAHVIHVTMCVSSQFCASVCICVCCISSAGVDDVISLWQLPAVHMKGTVQESLQGNSALTSRDTLFLWKGRWEDAKGQILVPDYIAGKDHFSVMIKYWNCDKLMYTFIIYPN